MLIGGFSEGFSAVRNVTGKYGFIDTTGKPVIDCQFQLPNPFINGQATIQLLDLWGTIDKTGKLLVEPVHKDPHW